MSDSGLGNAIERGGDEAEWEISFIDGEAFMELIMLLMSWWESSFPFGMRRSYVEFILCEDEADDKFEDDGNRSFADDVAKWLKRKTLWPLKQFMYWCAVTQLEQR